MTLGYCFKCKAKREMAGAHKVRVKNGRYMMKGKCSRCHCGMCRTVAG